MRPGATRAAALAFLTASCVPGAIGRTTPDPASRRFLVASIDSMVRQPEFRNAHWGILIVDPERADTIYSWNAGKLFMPASNMKLITGAVALAKLGPDFRFRTTFVARGPIADSVLRGDLVVHGRGDPAISEGMLDGDARPFLLGIADSLVARGIRRIDGRVLAGDDVFSDPPWGFGWAWDDFDFAYSAGVDELFLNEGFARLDVRAADSAGGAPRVTVFPVAGFPPVQVTATTIAPGDSARTRLRVETVGSGPEVVLSGTIVLGDSATRTVSYRDQRVAFLAALGEALAARGVAVTGRDTAAGRGAARPATVARSGNGPADAPPADSATHDTLFVVWSPPLSMIMPRFEKPSQNQIGEILLKTLGLEFTGVGTADSGRRVVERQLVEWGADTTGFVIRDGSGLSRHNYLSPATIVTVLDAMRRAPTFPVYYNALPIGGVDGTISNRMRGTPAENNVRGKTGTIDRARSLSGYVTTADGRMLLFSLLCNNYTVPTSWPTRMQDSIAARLATLRRR